MDKIKIFQFPIRNSNGGVTHYAMNNWNYLDKERFSCDFGTVSKYLDFQNEIISSGAGVKYVSCYAEEDQARFITEMRDILERGKYDIVHLHTNWWKSFLVEEIAKECRVPKIIVHAHNTGVDLFDSVKRKEAERVHEIKKQQFNTSMATDFWSCSALAADWLFGPQIPREKIKIMHFAIELERFAYNRILRDEYRRKYGFDGCFVIGTIGRYVYQKNQKFLIDVFAKVCERIANAKLLLIGSGMLESELKKQAAILGVANKVVFTSVDDITKCGLLQAMDLFCLPSRFEGCPGSMTEAQAAGLMCLASDVITEEVVITENVMMLPLDWEQWQERIVELSKGYERRNLYEELTNAGYNIKHQIKDLEVLYTS